MHVTKCVWSFFFFKHSSCRVYSCKVALCNLLFVSKKDRHSYDSSITEPRRVLKSLLTKKETAWCTPPPGDMAAGSPPEINLGDNTDPSPLLAKYGPLDGSSPVTFCRLMHLREEIFYLGRWFRSSGRISLSINNGLLRNQRLVSSRIIFVYLWRRLQKHVDGTLRILDNPSDRAQGYDVRTHPRVPIILKHEYFVKDSFLDLKENLNVMAIKWGIKQGVDQNRETP